jgi:outer membrane protein
VARTEIKKQQSAYAPSLDLTYTTDKNDTGGSLFGGGSDVKTNNLILKLNVPIFDGGVTHAVSSAAALRHEESKEELDKEKRLVDRQTRFAYNAIVGGVQRIAALQKSVHSLETARQLKEEGYRAGIGTLLGVLDAERDLYAAKRDAEQARYDYVLNRLKLKQSVGELTEQDLLFISNGSTAQQ